MRFNCELRKISDIADVIGGGTPSSKVEEYYGGNISWITPKDLSNINTREISDGERSITDLGLQKSSARLVPKGTILFTSRAPIGYVAIAKKELCTNQGFKSLVLKQDNDSDFFYYLIKYNVPLFESRASGSTFKEVSGQIVKDTELRIPDYPIQIQIGKLLKSFDDKVELNHQINQTLEQMAQALFKSWFVDFDPVKAKIRAKDAWINLRGEIPASDSPVYADYAHNLSAAAMSVISDKTTTQLEIFATQNPEQYQSLKTTADLFPDAMQDSELANVPEGWEVSEIGKEVTVVGGGTPSTKTPEYWGNGTNHWTTPKDLSGLYDKIITNTERKITDAGLAKISSGLLPVDTVLMSSRAPVGYLALAKVPIAINQGYIAMKCEKVLTPEYVIQWCYSVMHEIKQRASGTTFAEISKKNFNVIPVIVPKHEIVAAYSKVVSDVYKGIENNVMENQSLTQLRDTLLPKLLSGQLVIKHKNLS